MGKRSLHPKLGVIVLAAGKGTRMESNLAKVLHRVAGQPMLSYVLGAAREMKAATLAVVVGYQAGQVRETFAAWKGIRWVRQQRMRGTGDAVRSAAGAFTRFSGPVLILYGDIPGIRVETLRRLCMVHGASKNVITILTAELEDPTGYGRVLTDPDGGVSRIVEEKDASDDEKEIYEINTGIGIYDSKFLFDAVEHLKPANKQGEFYLTDLVSIARSRRLPVGRLRVKDPDETLGINDRESLAQVSCFFEERAARRLMEAGVTLKDPASTAVEPSVEVGKDTVIGGQVILRGKTKIGSNAVIEAGVEAVDSEIAAGVHLGRNVSAIRATLGRKTFIGAHSTIGRTR